MADDNSLKAFEDRIDVLSHSLLIESAISLFLGFLLDIKEPQNAKSLNGSSGLSYSQKINLLIDIGALSDSDRKTYQYFMEVRNKFYARIFST